MSVFGAYSLYYDLLYRDKDYRGEADYVSRCIEQARASSQSVLDLGCGTGRHDFLLAERGFDVTGVDLSEDMLAAAGAERARRAVAGSAARLPTFAQGDARTLRLGRTFDVVVSLFHVMSYQTSNDDLLAALGTIREHLRVGGVFLFDAWYGPAVLTTRPEVRIKRLHSERAEVTRLAEPVLHPNQNVVDVNYQIFVKDTATGQSEELRETHRMRYLFEPEVRQLVRAAGLRLDAAREFATDRELGFDTWNAMFIGTRVD